LMQQRSLQQVRVSVSLIFLIHGLIIATWASRIPAFQAHLHLSSAVLGRSLMMAAIGSVLAMPAAGGLINKFGSLSIVIGLTLGFRLALPLISPSSVPATGGRYSAMLVRQDLLSIGETQLTMTNVYPRFFHWEHSGQHFAPSRCPTAWGLVQSSARLRQIVFSRAG
jgi:fucose permease